MTKTKRRLLLISSLVIAVIISFAVLQELSIPASEDENRIRHFHNEPKDTLDVVIIGSSDVYTGFSAALAYKDYGIKTYPYSISGETCLMWETMVKDILKNQTPQIILIETYGAGYSDKHLKDTVPEVFKLLDTMPLSVEKFKISAKMAELTDKSDALSYFLPLIKYHSRYGNYYRNLSKRTFLHRKDTTPLKGVHNRSAVFEAEKLIDLSEVDEVNELSKMSDTAVREFIDYCKSVDTKIVFVKFPMLAKEEGSFMYKKHCRSNMVGQIAQENGFDFINLQKYSKEMGLEELKDFYDFGHANVYGQKKITKQLCDILRDEYGVTPNNCCDTENDKEWQSAAELYEPYFNLADKRIKQGKSSEMKDDEKTLNQVINGID